MEKEGKRAAMCKEIEEKLTELSPAEVRFTVAFIELMKETGAEGAVRIVCNIADAFRASQGLSGVHGGQLGG